MGTFRAAALAFFAWATLAQAQVPAPSPAPAPTPPRQVPEMEVLNKEYEARAKADALDQHAAAVADLNKRYAAPLLRAQDSAQQSGKLEAVLAFKAELERIGDDKPVPGKEDEAKDPDELKALRETYRNSLAKLDAERDTKLLPLNTALARHLDDLVVSLTKDGRLEDALAVSARRKEIVIPDAPPGAEKKKEGAAGPAITGAKTLRFQATVPATDIIKIANGVLWIEDHAIAFYPYNIKINGKPWKPVWGDNRTSDKYDLSTVIGPLTDAHVTVHKTRGRGTVDTLTQPTADSAQTFSFRIYDPPAGEGNYDVTLSW